MARIRRFEDGERIIDWGDEQVGYDQYTQDFLSTLSPAQRRIAETRGFGQDIPSFSALEFAPGTGINISGLGELPYESLRTGDRASLDDLRNMYDQQWQAFRTGRWKPETLPDLNMGFEDYLASPFSAFDPTGMYVEGKRTQVPYGLSDDPNFTKKALGSVAAILGAGSLYGGLSGVTGAGEAGAGVFGDVAGGSSNFFTESPFFTEGAEYLGSEFVPEFSMDRALDSLGTNWMDEMVYSAGDPGLGAEGLFDGEYLTNADTWVDPGVEPDSWWPEDWSDALDHPVPGQGGAPGDYPMPPPDVPGSVPPALPPRPSNGGGGGIPEWATKVATALGTSPQVLGRILGSVAGGVGGAISGNQTAGVGKEQVAIGAPARARFEAMSAAPGEWAKRNTRALVDAAADRRARMWSQKVGNPAESPTATIATDLDLAQLEWEMEQGEKAMQLAAGKVGLEGYDDIIAGRSARDRAISGGVGGVFDSIFNPRKERTTEEVIAQLMIQYPELFGRRTA